MKKSTLYDAVIIGGGHNGLVCACYLAAAGWKVRVLERRDVVGGAAVTEEFHPGFRNSVASYTVSLLQPKIIRDLRLHSHGLRILERPLANFLPLPDNGYLKIGTTPEVTQKEIAKISPHDAEQLSSYQKMLEGVVDLLRGLLLETPPGGDAGFADLLTAIKLRRRWRRLTASAQRDVVEIFTRSAGRILDYWFDSAPVKAAFGWDAVVGNYASPYTPGSGYVLLHHAFGEVNGKPGSWGHAIGGMGAITQAMQAEALDRGVEISLNAPVARVAVDGQRARGVQLVDGSFVSGRAVIANVNPRTLYLDLIDPGELEGDFLERMRRYECHSATFRINVALSELPEFTCLPNQESTEHLKAGIIIGPSLAYMEQAYLDAQRDGWSKAPIVELMIPSTVDDTLVRRPGTHVASLFCQHFNYALPDRRRWNDFREDAVRTIIETVDRYAPNFASSIIAVQALSPFDLEQTFGLVGGDIFHGALTLNQLYSNRPLLGFGRYRGPVQGLYMCGSGTHPGGGVTGAPGYNSAREVLRDASRWRRPIFR